MEYAPLPPLPPELPFGFCSKSVPSFVDVAIEDSDPLSSLFNVKNKLRFIRNCYQSTKSQFPNTSLMETKFGWTEHNLICYSFDHTALRYEQLIGVHGKESQYMKEMHELMEYVFGVFYPRTFQELPQ